MQQCIEQVQRLNQMAPIYLDNLSLNPQIAALASANREKEEK